MAQTTKTETLDRLYLEWSQFTKARTWRDLHYEAALSLIANSNPNNFEDPASHANWCVEHAQFALSAGAAPPTIGDRHD